MQNKIQKIVQIILGVIASSIVFAVYAQPQLPFPSLAPVLKNAMPAIVNIAAQGVLQVDSQPEEGQQFIPNKSTKPKKFQSMASGVIFDPNKGLVITNDHVIRHAQLITVTLNDGRRLKATLVGGDSETDVAVLKIDAKKLKSLPIGNSDQLEVGDFAVAIGNPFGLNSFGNNQSATFGIISALKRSDLNIEGVENFIQTDAAINPGNSGGALINVRGELIGINTAIISPYGGNIGIGFAIPINMVKDVVDQLLRFGSIHRGLMGIYVQHLTPELAEAMGYDAQLQGALVAQVNEQSPAEQAGIKAGDIITQINNVMITEASQVKTAVGLLRVGSQAKLVIMRDHKQLTLNPVVTDVKRHEQQLQALNPLLYGLSLRNFQQNSPLVGEITGVQVVMVSENSAGWRAGLRPGDVIIAANKQKTPTADALKKIALQHTKQLLVQVLRGPGAMYLLII